MAEQSRGAANTGAALKGAGTLLTLWSQNKQSKLAEAESRKQSSLLNLTADEIMLRFEHNKKQLENQNRLDIGRSLSTMGATGGSIDNMTLISMMNESLQQIDVLQREAEHEAYIKRQEAEAYERQARNEAKARKKNTMGTILGTAGTIAGTAYGGPAGGMAGGSAGYAAGSALG